MRGFSLTLPPNWTRVDLTSDAGGIERMGRSLVAAAVPTQQPSVRRAFDSSLRPQLNAFADHGVTTVAFPVGQVMDVPIRPFVSFRPLPPATKDPLLYLSAAAESDDNAEPWHSEWMTGLRTRRQVTIEMPEAHPQPDAAAETGAMGELNSLAQALGIPDNVALNSIHVEFTIGNSGSAEDWISVQAAILFADTNEAIAFAHDAESIVDALVSTFRWVA